MTLMMKSKKNKNLAQGLMDDLLEDEEYPSLDQVEQDNVVEIKASEKKVDGYDFTEESEATEVVFDSSDHQQQNQRYKNSEIENTKKIQIKTAVGRPFSQFEKSDLGSGGEGSLSRFENLRIAQEKILSLEYQIDKIREENIELSVASENLMKRYDATYSEKEDLRKLIEIKVSQYETEIDLLKDAIVNKDAENIKLKERNENMSTKVSANMQKIKMRERELENRLELVKIENSTLLRNKNEMILDLKRNIDQLNMELEKYRKKGQELNRQLDERKDILNRTVKTLRISLTMLESGSSGLNPFKKKK